LAVGGGVEQRLRVFLPKRPELDRRAGQRGLHEWGSVVIHGNKKVREFLARGPDAVTSNGTGRNA
jgi:hypothetical protein